MDKIYRKFNLEQAKNRTKNPLLYYSVDEETNKCTRHSDGNSWGGYCVDILIPKAKKNKTDENIVEDEESNAPVRRNTPGRRGVMAKVSVIIPITPTDDCSECSPLITWASDLEDTLHFDEVEIPVYEDETQPTNGGENDTHSGGDDDTQQGDDDIQPGGDNNTQPTGNTQQIGVVKYYVGRYKNLMMMYHWLINVFIPSIVFYRKCNCEVPYKQIKVSDRYKLFETAVKLFETLPTDDDFSVGTIIGVTNLYNEFIHKFTSFESGQGFFLFMKKLLTEGLFPPLSWSIPYIDVEFALTNKITDIGLMSAAYENWAENKKYYLGDVVSYLGDIYILHTCDIGNYDKFELTGELLKEVLDSPNDYEFIDDASQIGLDAYRIIFGYYTDFSYTKYVLREVDETGILRYYLIQPYYKGYHNETTKVTAFDDAPNNHWKLWTQSTPLVDIHSTQIEDDTEYTGITESKLISLKRKIASVDDFGEILPFIIKDDEPSNSDGELQYMTGVTNEIRYEDGTFRGDALLDVEINPLNQESGWTSVVSEYITSTDFDDAGFVRFTYVIGCELDENKDIIPYTGVKYEEVWNYNKSHTTAIIEHIAHDFNYISFTPINDNKDINNLDIVNKNPILSKITYYGKELNKSQLFLCPYIKEEDLLGVQDVNTLEYDSSGGRYVSAIDVHIERGKAGALEKHQILGEIKTFADLENYRNNFFQI